MLRNADLSEGFVVRTDFQTTGKGQQGNAWESERGANLLFSLLLYPRHIGIEQQFLISQAVCLGIKKTLDKYLDRITIKWPNDIYWKDKKLSGILIQNALQEAMLKSSIVGIGLNVNQTIFTSDAPNPISMRQITNKIYNRDQLLSEIYTNIMDLYKNADKVFIEQEYNKSLYRRSGFHAFRADNEVFQAKIHSVGSDGLLTLETKKSEKRGFYFKEVEFMRM
jgi:birA, biotin-[acetyl-CoA-carboxylase] ligase region